MKRNVELLPYKRSTIWRKVATGVWQNPVEASVYGWVDFDADGINRVIKEFHDKGKKISPTTIAAKAIAVAIQAYPEVNSMIRFGKIYRRTGINIFLQVAADSEGKDLSGLIIKDCEKKTLEEIYDEIHTKASKIKHGDDPEYNKIKKNLNMIPGILMGMMMKLLGFIVYSLNYWTPALGVPRDAFGSAMVTSIGMLGLQRGFAPLLPYAACPIIIAVGRLEKKPVIKGDQVVAGEVLPICATLDHRFVDGVGASKMFKTLTEYLKAPY